MGRGCRDHDGLLKEDRSQTIETLVERYLEEPQVAACASVAGSFGLCKEISFGFKQLAESHGIELEVIKLLNPYGIDWQQMDRRWYSLRAFIGHYVISLPGGRFLDFTARQFLPQVDFPSYWSADQLKELWQGAYTTGSHFAELWHVSDRYIQETVGARRA